MNYNDIFRCLGITELNVMQEATVDAARRYSQIVLLSPTGSGKTLAYLLPMVDRIDIKRDDVQAVVIVPSRELAKQTQQVLQQIGEGVRSVAVYGGRAAMEEHRTLRGKRPHVIIGTPGRLNDHLCKLNFSAVGVGMLVIDEFDKCLELGFQEEMQQVLQQLPNVKRRTLLSATDCPEIPMFVSSSSSPSSSSSLSSSPSSSSSSSPLSDYVRLDFLDDEQQIPDRIEVGMVRSEQKDKLESLGKLLCHLGQRSSIVFVNYRESVERTAQYLTKQGFSAIAFHGGMDQDLRERALFRFSSGACNILVCTDLAARGLDLPEVDSIIHYHLPLDEQAYVHRNGRTARWDANGEAFLLLGPEEYQPDYIEGELPLYQLPEHLPSPALPKWESMYIGRGKKDKLSRGDIAGFMMKIGGLAKEEVGRIEVRDHCAYVSVKRSRVRELMLRIRGHKIKGMKTIIEPTK